MYLFFKKKKYKIKVSRLLEIRKRVESRVRKLPVGVQVWVWCVMARAPYCWPRETRSQLTWWQIPSGISEAVRIIDSEATVTLVNQSALA